MCVCVCVWISRTKKSERISFFFFLFSHIKQKQRQKSESDAVAVAVGGRLLHADQRGELLKTSHIIRLLDSTLTSRKCTWYKQVHDDQA